MHDSQRYVNEYLLANISFWYVETVDVGIDIVERWYEDHIRFVNHSFSIDDFYQLENSMLLLMIDSCLITQSSVQTHQHFALLFLFKNELIKEVDGRVFLACSDQ